MTPIIITGCPRSGTGYASKLFQYNGYDVGHERLGADGISSWEIASGDANSIFGPSYTELVNKLGSFEMYHQVRNPIECISSMTSISEKSFEYIKKYILHYTTSSPIEVLMAFWIEWNTLAEKLSVKTYRLEDILKEFPELKAYPNKRYNTRPHQNLTLENLYKENPELAELLIKKASSYGYTQLK